MKKLDFSPLKFDAYNLSQAFGFLTPKEVFALKTLAWSLPDHSVIVNVGAGAGTSGLLWAESTNETIRRYTVDISPGGPEGGLQNEINAFAPTTYKIPVQMLGDSKQLGHEWNLGQIDLLFIDADHSYESAKADITEWGKHVKLGGIIAVHDYCRDVWPDVKKAVDEVCRPYTFLFHVDTVIAFRVC